ncbi:MAG TPA: biotin/lipoyl-containing protein, partial [Streptosporangiaceae bacterium]|nr:biotin/lipoyl-containing protein [Streptosporangiaceae bacterium]
AAAAAAAAVAAANRRDATVAASIPGGWRNVPSQPQLTSFTGPSGRMDVRYSWTRTGITVVDVAGPDSGQVPGDLTVVAFAPHEVTLEVAGVQHRFRVIRAGEEIWVSSALGSVRFTLLDRLPPPQLAAESGSLIAPMPGNVTRLAAAPGDLVTAGQPVLVIEAMKMEHTITAPAAGVLAELRVRPGEQVSGGDVLAIVVVPEARGTSTVPEARGTSTVPEARGTSTADETDTNCTGGRG